MARTPRQLEIELAPAPQLPSEMGLGSDGAVVSESWLKASAILIRGMARREARLGSSCVAMSFESVATVAGLQTPNTKVSHHREA